MKLYSNIIGEGKPILILHGFMGMGDNWKTIAAKLAEDGYEVHLVDQRNHGRSFHDDDFSYEVMGKDIKEYCDAHGIKGTIIMGHSMGGKTAMTVASEYPGLIEKLIVADISPRFYPVHHEQILKGLRYIEKNEPKSRGEADELLSKYVTDSGVRQFLLKNLYRDDDNNLKLRLNLAVLSEKVEEVGESLPSFAKYDGPTLFVRGDRSEYIHDGDLAHIKHHFPNAVVKTVNDAGHWLHAENPEEFLRIVTEFLRN
ncbi:alpha/beta fold hydrolase [Aegicerativicinus sediminis]|uniref:alpha/beta fold hydrolase n=1 Tax=Aegicerativicinus sediminis TaxID=2893202 RepID=UPI001E4605F9|nr:alpha/beta fold hydrolase [Aegicerativicinus sediminis]